MQTAVSVKAGAAFLAGVVLALGGAFTYFRVADSRSQSVVQPAAKVPESSSSASDSTPVPKAAEPVVPGVEAPSASVSTSVVDLPTTKKQKPVEPKLAMPRPRVTSRPVSLAVAKPAAQSPAAIPAPVLVVTRQDTPAVVAQPSVTPVVAAVQEPVPLPQPHIVTIPAGTSLAVRLSEKISTDHNFSGDTFRATLDAPVVVDGFIIAERGAKVLGRIVKAQKPGKLEGAAELSLTLTEIATTDGQTMQVDTNQSLRKGPSSTGEEVAKMGGGAALGAIIGAIAGGGKGAAIGAGAGGAAGTGAVLLGHGKPAVIDSETRLTFELANPTTLTEKLN